MAADKRRRWTEEDVARIAGLYRAGISIKEIAQRFGTTPAAISNLTQRKAAYRTLTRTRSSHRKPSRMSVIADAFRNEPPSEGND